MENVTVEALQELVSISHSVAALVPSGSDEAKVRDADTALLLLAANKRLSKITGPLNAYQRFLNSLS